MAVNPEIHREYQALLDLHGIKAENPDLHTLKTLIRRNLEGIKTSSTGNRVDTHNLDIQASFSKLDALEKNKAVAPSLEGRGRKQALLEWVKSKLESGQATELHELLIDHSY